MKKCGNPEPTESKNPPDKLFKPPNEIKEQLTRPFATACSSSLIGRD